MPNREWRLSVPDSRIVSALFSIPIRDPPLKRVLTSSTSRSGSASTPRRQPFSTVFLPLLRSEYRTPIAAGVRKGWKRRLSFLKPEVSGVSLSLQDAVHGPGLDPQAELEADGVSDFPDRAFTVDEVPGLVGDDP